MNRTLPTLSVLFATLLCVAECAIAQPPQPMPRSAKVLRAVLVNGTTLVMDGERLVARLADENSTHYVYTEGRLSSIHHSDGRFATYYYDDEQRLERIDLSDGQVQRAVYQAGALALLGNEAGQRLHVAPPARAPGHTAAALAGRAPPQVAAGVAAAPAKAAADSLNHTLIAVAGWEKHSWDCRFSPQEFSLCGGGGDGGRGPYDGGGWSADGGGGPFRGGGWDGGDFAPYPTNLPTRMSCLAAATSTFEIMRDQVCSMVKDKAICTAQNHKLFDELWKECMATYPG
ncbi:RHS repeat domain-containing protein [Massilia sp. CCM 8734]|uniref:RHS repeat domain-containing protein n=1 Tax=Massilia sp. CCM 8734 TaxID=2609283 RepID=UPI00141F234D|nr:RHS repeat domain-containing protein [Massilia sp. CCM 8734]NIA00143.1 hypothetical protein [Massilia sp. CCM 8734]